MKNSKIENNIINRITEVIFELEVCELSDFIQHVDHMIALINIFHVKNLLLKTEGNPKDRFWNGLLERHVKYMQQKGILVSSYPQLKKSKQPLQTLLGFYYYARVKNQFFNATEKRTDQYGHSLVLIASLSDRCDLVKAIQSPQAIEALSFIRMHFFNVIECYVNLAKQLEDVLELQKIMITPLYQKLKLMERYLLLSPIEVYKNYSISGYLIIAELYITAAQFLCSIKFNMTEDKKWLMAGLRYLYIAKGLESTEKAFISDLIGKATKSLNALFPPLVEEQAKKTVSIINGSECKAEFIFSLGLRKPFVKKLTDEVRALNQGRQEEMLTNLNALCLRKRQTASFKSSFSLSPS